MPCCQTWVWPCAWQRPIAVYKRPMRSIYAYACRMAVHICIYMGRGPGHSPTPSIVLKWPFPATLRAENVLSARCLAIANCTELVADSSPMAAFCRNLDSPRRKCSLRPLPRHRKLAQLLRPIHHQWRRFVAISTLRAENVLSARCLATAYWHSSCGRFIAMSVLRPGSILPARGSTGDVPLVEAPVRSSLHAHGSLPASPRCLRHAVRISAGGF